MASLLCVGSAFLLGSVALGNAHAGVGADDPQAKAQAPDWSEYRYEVVSIKLLPEQATPAFRGLVADLDPGGISIRKTKLLGVVQSAYGGIANTSSGFGLREEQIVGLPKWADTALYAIDGKMNPSVATKLAKLSPSEQTLARAHMLQVMLADRFKLKAHPQDRDGRVYYLASTGNHPKLKPAAPGETYPTSPFGKPYRPGSVVMGKSEPGSTKRLGLGAPMEELAKALSDWLHCPVIDRTGITGKYDFELQWTASEGAEAGPATNWPSLFTAIREQLGLKLDPGKGPVPFLVIDHVEMPSGN